jgi:hypothetical protein
MPIPTFEDIRKILQFWIDQQDKWFFFEGPLEDSGSVARELRCPPHVVGAIVYLLNPQVACCNL